MWIFLVMKSTVNQLRSQSKDIADQIKCLQSHIFPMLRSHWLGRQKTLGVTLCSQAYSSVSCLVPSPFHLKPCVPFRTFKGATDCKQTPCFVLLPVIIILSDVIVIARCWQAAFFWIRRLTMSQEFAICLCHAQFIPLWKRNALWELINKTHQKLTRGLTRGFTAEKNIGTQSVQELFFL